MLYKWIGWKLIAAVAIVLTSFFTWRIDLTAENRYTISPASEKLLKNLPEAIEITVLLQSDNLPSGFKKLQNATEGFLADCRSLSQGKLQYQFVTPDDFLADSIRFPIDDTFKLAWLKNNAVKQNEITQSGTSAIFVHPIALVKSVAGFATVNLLEGQGNKGFLNPDASGIQLQTIDNAEAQMEYLFASAIQSLHPARVPAIAYAVGNGQPMGPETFDLSQTLQAKYSTAEGSRFFLLNLQQQPYISDSIEVLMVVKPTIPFSDADKLKLDQYVMRGGKLLLLLDVLNAGMDSLIQSGKDFTAFSRNLGLEDLIFKYGARINQDLVQDKQSDMLPQAVGNVGNTPQIELLPWPYFPLLYSSTNHPISKNLDAVVMQFPNSIDTVKAAGISKTILLASSNASRRVGAPVIVTVEILKQLENASAFKEANIPVAVLLQGRFSSLYANRLDAGILDSLQQLGRPFLPAGTAVGQVLVTGDGDWVLNGFSKEGPLPMGTNPYTQYAFANKNLLLNAIDFMTDETGLMATRSKEYTLRILDPKKVESSKITWQWINIGLPLLLLAVSATILHLQRRKKYGSA